MLGIDSIGVLEIACSYRTYKKNDGMLELRRERQRRGKVERRKIACWKLEEERLPFRNYKKIDSVLKGRRRR